MRIAITGSWRSQDREKWKLRDQAGFHRVMKDLGAELVALGHRLVVASLSRHTADAGAIEGAMRRLPQNRVYTTPVIDLFQGEPKPQHDEDARFQRDVYRRAGLVNLLSAPPDRQVIKLHQVDLADVVLAVGGATMTLQAAIAAAVSGKRIVPVGSFGGAAHQAAEIFEATAAQWGAHVPPQDVLGPLRAPWTVNSKELVLRALGVRAPRILIVHGRDLDSRDALVKLLVDLDLPQPIVMAAQATLGRALPEKFEQLAVNVDAAIALVTPDDVGGLRGESPRGLRGRARQNVWVEVGWFWGKLGRARVLLVGKRGVEVPSDLSGLLIEEFDHSPASLETKITEWVESLGWPKPGRRRARRRTGRTRRTRRRS